MKQVVKPTGGDDTAAIQAALDAVAKLPLVGGHRGSVLLAPGVFHCSDTLQIHASGVVLRGAGSDEKGGSTIELTGKPHLALSLSGAIKIDKLSATTLADAYVPSGTWKIHVADASAIHSGDTLELVKPVTPAWVKFMGMDKLVRSGKEEHWVGGDLTVRRRVLAVDGKEITFEVPLTDSIDSAFFPGATAAVTKVAVSGQIAEVGVESLRVVAPPQSIELGKDAEFDGLQMKDAVDSWVRSVNFEDTTNSVRIESGTERIWVTRVDVQQKVPVSSAAKPFDFSVNGTQVFLDRISGSGDSVFYVATQAREQGPVAVLHCRFLGDGHIQPHQRWSTGLLIDQCEVPGGGIDLQNRGHGWTIGWSVLWNSSAASSVVQMPPGVADWSIGERGGQDTAPQPTTGGPKGPPLPQGIIESPGKPVLPASLYLQQLQQRLGPAALTAIGYGPDDLTRVP